MHATCEEQVFKPGPTTKPLLQGQSQPTNCSARRETGSYIEVALVQCAAKSSCGVGLWSITCANELKLERPMPSVACKPIAIASYGVSMRPRTYCLYACMRMHRTCRYLMSQVNQLPAGPAAVSLDALTALSRRSQLVADCMVR